MRPVRGRACSLVMRVAASWRAKIVPTRQADALTRIMDGYLGGATLRRPVPGDALTRIMDGCVVGPYAPLAAITPEYQRALAFGIRAWVSYSSGKGIGRILRGIGVVTDWRSNLGRPTVQGAIGRRPVTLRADARGTRPGLS